MWFPGNEGNEGKTVAGILSRGGFVVLQAKNWRLTAAGDNCHGCIRCGSRESSGV